VPSKDGKACEVVADRASEAAFFCASLKASDDSKSDCVTKPFPSCCQCDASTFWDYDACSGGNLVRSCEGAPDKDACSKTAPACRWVC
jgi:hypothetical protein